MTEPRVDRPWSRLRRRPVVIAAAAAVCTVGVGAGLLVAGGDSQAKVTTVQAAASQTQPGSQAALPATWTLPSLPANPTAGQIAARDQALAALRAYASALGSQAASLPAASQLSDFGPPRLPAGATEAQIVADKNAGRALHAYEMAVVPAPAPTPIPMGMLEAGGQAPVSGQQFVNDQYAWTGYVSGKLTMVWAGADIPQTTYATNSSLPGEVVVMVDPASREVAHPTTADTGGTSTTSLYPAPAGTTELQLVSVNGDLANLKSTNGTTLTFNLVTHVYQITG